MVSQLPNQPLIYIYIDVSLHGGTPQSPPQNDHFFVGFSHGCWVPTINQLLTSRRSFYHPVLPNIAEISPAPAGNGLGEKRVAFLEGDGKSSIYLWGDSDLIVSPIYKLYIYIRILKNIIYI